MSSVLTIHCRSPLATCDCRALNSVASATERLHFKFYFLFKFKQAHAQGLLCWTAQLWVGTDSVLSFWAVTICGCDKRSQTENKGPTVFP